MNDQEELIESLYQPGGPRPNRLSLEEEVDLELNRKEQEKTKDITGGDEVKKLYQRGVRRLTPEEAEVEELRLEQEMMIAMLIELASGSLKPQENSNGNTTSSSQRS